MMHRALARPPLSQTSRRMSATFSPASKRCRVLIIAISSWAAEPLNSRLCEARVGGKKICLAIGELMAWSPFSRAHLLRSILSKTERISARDRLSDLILQVTRICQQINGLLTDGSTRTHFLCRAHLPLVQLLETRCLHLDTPMLICRYKKTGIYEMGVDWSFVGKFSTFSIERILMCLTGSLVHRTSVEFLVHSMLERCSSVCGTRFKTDLL